MNHPMSAYDPVLSLNSQPRLSAMCSPPADYGACLAVSVATYPYARTSRSERDGERVVLPVRGTTGH